MRRVKLLHAYKMDDPLIVGDAGQVVHLTHYAAQLVVRAGDGEYVDGGEQPGPTRAELEAQEAEIGTLKKVGDDSYEETPHSPGPGDAGTNPHKAGEPETPKKPYGNAPKSAWVRYACQVDENMTEERAEDLTKADLMSRYGERL